MDRRLAELNIASRDTIWKEYGGGLRENEKATLENWKRIAEDDILYDDVGVKTINKFNPIPYSTLKNSYFVVYRRGLGNI